MDRIGEVEIIQTSADEKIGTIFFKIEVISNWDLHRLYDLLRAEKARAEITHGFDRGLHGLLEALKPIAKKFGWGEY